MDVPAHDKNSKLPKAIYYSRWNAGKPWETIWASFNG